MSRTDLVTDCRRCVALCCVATSFERSEDFAFDKPAGVRCGLLSPDCRCRIHDELQARGQRGCAIYDCHGAGQRATALFGGREGGELQHAVFLVLRVVHELLWLLTGAAKLCPPSEGMLRRELARQLEALEHFAAMTPRALVDSDLAAQERNARVLLRRVGAAVGGRGAVRGEGSPRR